MGGAASAVSTVPMTKGHFYDCFAGRVSCGERTDYLLRIVVRRGCICTISCLVLEASRPKEITRHHTGFVFRSAFTRYTYYMHTPAPFTPFEVLLL